MKRKVALLLSAAMVWTSVGYSQVAFALETPEFEEVSEVFDAGEAEQGDPLFEDVEAPVEEEAPADGTVQAEESGFAEILQPDLFGEGEVETEEETSPDRGPVVARLDEDFPDENFRKYLKENVFQNSLDGNLYQEDVEDVTELYFQNIGVKSLEGIQYFTKLKELTCTDNQLTSLDVSKNVNLKLLQCGNNQLTSLDVSKNAVLKELSCYGNQLKSLDVSSSLGELHCYKNQLTSLDLSKNTNLTYISCFENQLTSLDVSKSEELWYLNCSENQLTSLDVSKNAELKDLYCDNNQLTSLDVSKNVELKEFLCYNNQLTSLDVSRNGKLERLLFFGNRKDIVVREDNRFDLSTLPGDFDVSKASNWFGGTVEGNWLTVDEGAKWVTYTYDVGYANDSDAFTLAVIRDGEGTVPETPTEPTETPTEPTETPAEPTETPVQPTQAPAAPTPTVTSTPTPTVTPTPTPTPTPTKAPAKLKVGQTFTEKSVKYQVRAGNVVAVAGGSKSAKSVSIPATVKKNGVTYQVTAIKDKAFKKYKKLQKVTIGKNVTKIGKDAFSGCANLKTVSIQTEKLKSIGKNAFKGINKKAVITVPKKQYAKYVKYLKAAKTSKSVKIKK